MVQALRPNDTSSLIILSLFEQERAPGEINEKVVYLYAERKGLPGSYRHETPDLTGMPDFGFPKWVPTAEVDPPSPGAEITLSAWLPSQDICILEISWRFLIMSFLRLVVWVNLVVRRSVNTLVHIICSMYSDAVSWILSTSFPSMRKTDFKHWGLFFSFLAVSGGYM